MKIHSQKSDANTNPGETISFRVKCTSCSRNTGTGRDNFEVLLRGDVIKGKGSRKKRASMLGRTLCVNTAMSVRRMWE